MHNLCLDFEESRLPMESWAELVEEGVDLDFQEEHEFPFEPVPSFEIFSDEGSPSSSYTAERQAIERQ